MELQSDWSDLRKSPIDTFEIEMKARDFYNFLNFNEDDAMTDIYEAKSVLDSVRMLVFNLVNIFENEYVQAYSDYYEVFVDNNGRVEKFLEGLEEQTLKRDDLNGVGYAMRKAGLSPEKKHYLFVNYTRRLHTIFEHLVYYPIKKAGLRFKQPFFKEGKEVVKDEKLFCYFIFVELYGGTQSLGNRMFEKVTTIQNKYNIKGQPSEDRSSNPDPMPKNVKTKEEDENKDSEEIISKIEEFFPPEEDEESV